MAQLDIIRDVDQYYSNKIREHGSSPRGVDWNSPDSQFLRFEQLLRVIPDDESSIDIADLGCGYGALINSLQQMGRPFHYVGYDVSADMITKAQELYGLRENVRFIQSADIATSADYVVASGVFNVKMHHTIGAWEAYVWQVIEAMHAKARKGFAFNMLTAYSDADKMREHLYYPAPEAVFARLKQQFSRHVALLHDYGLYEFTMLVRRDT